jgi:hypothetical protein
MEKMSEMMQNLPELLEKNPFVVVLIVIIAAMAIVAQWALYSKAGQPGVSCLVPVWNIVSFLAIVGRPWQHMFLFLIPGYNIYLVIQVYIEICQSFGQRRTLDYVLCIVFNGFYLFNLALSQKIDYEGPAWKLKKQGAPLLAA